MLLNKPLTLSIFSDGGARGNPGPAAIGFVVKDNRGKIIYQHAQVIGSTTNNVAEYRAVIAALEWINRFPKRHLLLAIRFFLDSALVVNQLQGRFKIKSAHLAELIIKVKTLASSLNLPISYTAIPRSQNFLADSLVNRALDAARIV